MIRGGARNSDLKIGVGRRIMTPAKPELLRQTGMGRLQRTKGVLDDLFAEALAIEVGGQAAFVTTGDLEVIKRYWEFRVRDEVARRTGCDQRRVLLSAAHNHSGSPAPWDRSPEAKAAWREAEERVVQSYIDACVAAWESRRPAEIAYGEAALEEPVGENRRVRLSSGVAVQSWGSGAICPPGHKWVGAAGPDSKEVRFLLVREVGGSKPFAVLTAYPSHVHLANLPYFSGEFPGAAKREIERRLGGAVVLYANNMCGNIDVHCVHPQALGSLEDEVRWFRASQELLGRRFGDAVVKGARRIRRYRRPRELRHRYWSTGDGPARRDVDAPLTIVNSLRLGDVALVSMPGEIFIEYYLRLRRKSPIRKFLLLGYNGSDSQYIAEPIGVEMGGYETMHGPGAAGEVTKDVGLGDAMPRARVDAGERLEERLLKELRALA